MKLNNITYLLGVSIFTVSSQAFVPVSVSQSTTTTRTNTELAAATSMEGSNNRREFLSVGTMSLFGGMMALGSYPEPSFAEARPTYLTEPTAEFKENEQKAAAFKKQQLEQKQKFLAVLDKLTKEGNDEAALEKDLIDLRQLVIETQGLPLGIKKDELFKIIRTKKSKGFWPTKVEIA